MVDLTDVEKSVANAIVTRALFAQNTLLRAFIALSLLQAAQPLCFFFPLSQLPSFT